jgi:outer membrane protein
MKTILPILAVILIACNFSEAQPRESVTALSLREAVDLALRTHPALKASEQNFRAAEFRVDQVQGGFLPQVYFNTSFTRWDWVMPNKKVYLGNSLNDLYAEFGLQQLIYNGGKQARQQDLAESAVQSEALSSQRLRQAVTFGVAKAYFQLLKAQRLVTVQEATVMNLRDHLQTAEALYRIGKVSQVDVLKAQVQLAVAEDDLAKAQNNVHVQQLALNAAMGRETPQAVEVIDNVEQIWEREHAASFQEEIFLNELKNHPEMAKARLDIQTRGQEIALARADYYPSLYLRGGYNWEDSQMLPGNKNWNLGAALSLPLFRGGATKAQVRQAEARTEAAQSTEQALRQKLEFAVRAGLVSLEDAKRRVGSAQEIVRLAEESMKVTALKYSTGKGASLDVLDAQTVLTNARVSLTQALTDYALVKAELYFNLGAEALPFE